jgi:hypothetical protein
VLQLIDQGVARFKLARAREQVQIMLGRMQRERLIDLLERLRGNPAVIEINHERS